MKSYWLRSFIITTAFLVLCVTSIAAVSHPTLLHIAWASYFMVVVGLIVSHRKENSHKAMLNLMVLLMAGLPIACLSMPAAILFRNFEFGAIKGNFYIFISLVSLLYLAIRHEKLSIPEAASKVAVYVGEIRTSKLRSSFGKYLLGEAILFTLCMALGSYYLFR